MKKSRNIKTFQLDPENEPALENAQKAGLTIRDIVNKAIKDFNRRGGIKKLAQEKMETLSALSFNGPEFPSTGFAE